MIAAISKALVDGFVASAPILCATWIGMRWSRRRLNAATRYALRWIALVGRH